MNPEIIRTSEAIDAITKEINTIEKVENKLNETINEGKNIISDISECWQGQEAQKYLEKNIQSLEDFKKEINIKLNKIKETNETKKEKLIKTQDELQKKRRLNEGDNHENINE